MGVIDYDSVIDFLDNILCFDMCLINIVYWKIKLKTSITLKKNLWVENIPIICGQIALKYQTGEEEQWNTEPPPTWILAVEEVETIHSFK